MRISLLTANKKYDYDFPKNPYGSYWLNDENNAEQKIISVEAYQGNWIMQSNDEVKIIGLDGNYVEQTILTFFAFYRLKDIVKEKEYLLYCAPIYDISTKVYSYNQNTFFLSARGPIVWELLKKLPELVKITWNNGWKLEEVNTQSPLYATVYVNNEKPKLGPLYTGDVLFCMGLKIIFLGSHLVINNPNNQLTFQESLQEETITKEEVPLEAENLDLDIVLYEEKDYFFRSPRFITAIEKEKITIDAPPTKTREEDTPIFLLIGPMLTMGATSATTLAVTLSKMTTKETSVRDSLPSLVISIAMLCSMIMWPTLKRKYDKKKKKEEEAERQKKYSAYIEQKQTKINYLINAQRQILNENAISLADCQNVILTHSRDLWGRKIEQADFLNLKLGLGTLPLEVDIHYPEEHFTMEDDNLKDILNRVVEQSKDVTNVPITISLTEKYIVSLVGKDVYVEKILKDMLLQIVAFHSYEDVKVVCFFDENKNSDFSYFKKIPHIWNNQKNVRYYATTFEEMKELSLMLVSEAMQRNEAKEGYKSHLPYYIVIVNNYKMVQNLEFIKTILEQKENKGYTLLVLNEGLTELPNECTTFINVDGKKGGIFESELISTKQKDFTVDDNPLVKFNDCLKEIDNIPIKFTKGSFVLPSILSFLELYNVGKVEQLNVLYRWKNSNPTKTLQAPVGLDEYGMPFYIDLHEKAHGPHGLIAGMTGSGKSEFIITFILSLALNYHPYEVSFILIDYKGGGLAGAFENRQTGKKLPHLAGTITNLDVNQMNRALASIESELKRRQAIFNKTRELLNEGVIDIYKYQKLYREKRVKEPLSHLLIICDEFAELKVQQPDFMDQLISTARIGRSLGVHLILSTQKPSGVVNDQIWSNSRFRVCLKVQEKEDSMDMIKTPEAATIREKGRFYLQVGYNELFLLGQSAWSGAPYIPSNKIVKKKDNAITFISNTGDIYTEIKEEVVKDAPAQGEQLGNIVNYLIETAEEAGIVVPKLWLDPIPEMIYIEDLKEKYHFEKDNLVRALIGEYDDPKSQSQYPLIMPLIEEGNSIVYGTADTGSEKFLQTLVYSLITTYTAEDVNLYLIDLGSESLKIFENAPQVGGVVLNAETDRIKNLFQMLQKQIEFRKAKLLSLAGDYQLYRRQGNKDLPLIIVVINNIEGFREGYEQEQDELIQLSRDGLKYGIVFIVTSVTSIGAGFKLSQNFRQKYVLRMNDADEYSTILGRVGKMQPSPLRGRGLIKVNDDVYEFQTASFAPLGEELEAITSVMKEIPQEVQALKIPSLPNRVTIQDCISAYKNMSSIPIGIEKRSLQISTYDLKRNYITLITGQDNENIPIFVNPFVEEIGYLKNVEFQVLDMEKNLKNCPFKYNGPVEIWAKKIINDVRILNDQFVKSDYDARVLNPIKEKIYVINGFQRFKNALSMPVQTKFFPILETAMSLEKYHFILIDTIDKFKAVEYEAWYKTAVRTNQGIWIGNGIAEQYTIKINKVSKELYEELPKSFGYYVKSGNYKLVKLIESREKDE